MIAYPGAKHNSKLQPSAAQIPPGDAGRVVTDLLRGAEGHDPPAGISAAGAHVDDVVRIADDVQIMLDDHHSRAMDGSSNTNTESVWVRPISLASFRRWASPPERLGVSSPRVR